MSTAKPRVFAGVEPAIGASVEQNLDAFEARDAARTDIAGSWIAGSAMVGCHDPGAARRVDRQQLRDRVTGLAERIEDGVGEEGSRDVDLDLRDVFCSCISNLERVAAKIRGIDIRGVERDRKFRLTTYRNGGFSNDDRADLSIVFRSGEVDVDSVRIAECICGYRAGNLEDDRLVYVSAVLGKYIEVVENGLTFDENVKDPSPRVRLENLAEIEFYGVLTGPDRDLVGHRSAVAPAKSLGFVNRSIKRRLLSVAIVKIAL